MHVHTHDCTCSLHVNASKKRRSRRDRYDPTRTTMIRRRYEQALIARWKAIRRLIKEAVVDQDVFGFNEPSQFKTHSYIPNLLSLKLNAVPPKRAFAFTRSGDKVSAFMDWLQREMSRGVLEVEVGASISRSAANSWQNLYIESAYQRGLAQAAGNISGAGVTVEPSFIDSAFLRPIHADSVGIIYTRSFGDLKGITSEVEKQMSSVLAQGMAEGRGMMDVARSLTNRIDAIGIARSKVLARTEIINAHAEATLNTYEEADIEGVTVKAEFLTARDENVCPKCHELEGREFTIEEARGLIPVHPNCFLSDTAIEGKVIAGSKAIYSGPIVKIKSGKGHSLSVTPNHPILTDRGWIAAKDLLKSDKLLTKDSEVRSSEIGGAIYDYNFPARIDQIVKSLRSYGFASIQPSCLDFHGDGVGLVENSNIDIVGPNLELLRDLDLFGHQLLTEFSFPLPDVIRDYGVNSSSFESSISGFGGASLCLPRVPKLTLDHLSTLFDFLPFRKFSFGLASEWNVVKVENSGNSGSAISLFLRQLQNASSFEISFDDLVSIDFVNDGSCVHEVYDLQTTTGWVVANGVVASNCRCSWNPIVPIDDRFRVLR